MVPTNIAFLGLLDCYLSLSYKDPFSMCVIVAKQTNTAFL